MCIHLTSFPYVYKKVFSFPCVSSIGVGILKVLSCQHTLVGYDRYPTDGVLIDIRLAAFLTDIRLAAFFFIDIRLTVF